MLSDPASPDATPEPTSTVDSSVAPVALSVRSPGRLDWLAARAGRLGLTLIGLGMLVVAVLVVAIGRLASSHGLTLMGYAIVLVLVVSWVLGRRRLQIEATRSELPRRVPANRQVEAEITLSSSRRGSALIVEESLDRHLGNPIRVGVPVLPPGRPVTHTYTFTPAVRGIYNVGPLIAEFADPFGLTRRRQPIAEATSIIVHPTVEPVVDRITSREWEDPPVRPPLSRPWPSGFEFYGMRDYVPGDDPRRIVWRAVAQYDKYLVREAEQGITDRVNIYLDSDAEFHSKGNPSLTFESGVSVAASLAVKHLKDGFSVSFDLNSGRQLTNVRGAGKRVSVLDQLAAVTTDRVPLVRALDRMFVDPRRTSHNVLITPHLTQEAASRLRLLLERGSSIMVVLVLSDDTDPMTLHRAAGLHCNVVEVPLGAPLTSVFSHVVGGRLR